jgi:hypothetical protein
MFLWDQSNFLNARHKKIPNLRKRTSGILGISHFHENSIESYKVTMEGSNFNFLLQGFGL